MKPAEKGFIEAQALTHRHARTFYYASRFLPAAPRRAAYAVYAVCRGLDDSVDVPPSAGAHPERALNRLARDVDAAYAGTPAGSSLQEAFRETIRGFGIPREYFEDLIEGMRMDLTISRYEDFDGLYRYCYRVAGVVGLIMLRVFRVESAAAREYAVKLGVAMQLTNILRDIAEDAGRGRIYLPLEELRRFSVSEEAIINRIPEENFIRLMKFQVERAREWYRASQGGIGLIQNKRCRITAAMMKTLYGGILDEIENAGYNIFRERAHVSPARKCALALKTILARENR